MIITFVQKMLLIILKSLTLKKIGIDKYLISHGKHISQIMLFD